MSNNVKTMMHIGNAPVVASGESQIVKTLSKGDRVKSCSSTISDGAVTLPCGQQGLNAGVESENTQCLENQSFLLASQLEEIRVRDQEEFVTKLTCNANQLVKVVSIFGNTGDGKSHTLNHTLFGGREVFATSHLQTSCTAGVWAAYDSTHKAIVLDTEGLLGVSANENRRTRLLLKVLAVSDIIIYRSRSDRLHNDLFTFLGNASVAFQRHFSCELKTAAERFHLNDIAVSSLCPAVIIYHETQYTEPLRPGSAEDLLRRRFRELGLSIDSFSSLKYVGTQTVQQPTDFKCLLSVIEHHLSDQSLRSSRPPGVVFQTLKVLNDKFSGDIEKQIPNMFPDQYFTCRVQCVSCGARCIRSLNHLRDEIPHETRKEQNCQHQDQYENCFYLCKVCFKQGKEVVVMPKTSASRESSWLGLASYAWSGFVLECINCGVIYRSRQHWYGNVEPEKTGVVQTQIRHVWPEGNPVLQGTQNAGRRVIDGLTYVSETLAVVGAKPAKVVTKWVTDQIAPSYWIPNSDIVECRNCKIGFDEKITIHHCRSCGYGFCDGCSSKRRPVPERNWGSDPVRVCDACFEPAASNSDLTVSEINVASGKSNELVPRRVGEAIGSTVGTLATIVNYPIAALRDAARPTYWAPDETITECFICHEPFSPLLKLHHCRACGQGVCSECSPQRHPVPTRGWDYPVRVCKTCFLQAD